MSVSNKQLDSTNVCFSALKLYLEAPFSCLQGLQRILDPYTITKKRQWRGEKFSNFFRRFAYDCLCAASKDINALNSQLKYH